jgi:hypothetical protein
MCSCLRYTPYVCACDPTVSAVLLPSPPLVLVHQKPSALQVVDSDVVHTDVDDNSPRADAALLEPSAAEVVPAVQSAGEPHLAPSQCAGGTAAGSAWYTYVANQPTGGLAHDQGLLSGALRKSLDLPALSVGRLRRPSLASLRVEACTSSSAFTTSSSLRTSSVIILMLSSTVLAITSACTPYVTESSALNQVRLKRIVVMATERQSKLFDIVISILSTRTYSMKGFQESTCSSYRTSSTGIPSMGSDDCAQRAIQTPS